MKRYWSRAGEPSSCIWSEIDWEGSMAREASRDSESHNISLMRTGPAGHFGELAAVLGSAIMIVRPSRRIARGRYASSRRPSFSFEITAASDAREDAVISNGIA